MVSKATVSKDLQQPLGPTTAPWAVEENKDGTFADARLGKRFSHLLGQLTDGLGQSIPFACQDWANVKAAYRFFSNPRVSEVDILSGHFKSTQERFASTQGTVLVLHDTTEFSYKRENSEAIGFTHLVGSGPRIDGRIKEHKICGLLMHSSLAITTEGLPLGLAAIKFWSRKAFKGANALSKKINATRVPIENKESMRWVSCLNQSTQRLGEPKRCVHVGDRESDIYELFCAAKQADTHFLLRTCVDRLAGDGKHTVADEMNEVRCKGLHRLEVRDSSGKPRQALLELRYKTVTIQPPAGKRARYPNLTVTVLHATERNNPPDTAPIEWKLVTNLPITSQSQAIEKLHWYALRWKIEVFHKILKSGCKAEESKLRTAERLVNLIATFCILSWRIFWLTMLNRTQHTADPLLVFTPDEVKLLDQLKVDRGKPSGATPSLSDYIIKLAKLGGYLGRTRDTPPGNTVIWRGLTRLTDISLGVRIAKLVGN